MKRNLPPNPYFAFVEVIIGGDGTNLSPLSSADESFEWTKIPPEHLLQFTYTRKPLNSANKFILQVVDETAILLEYQLLTGYNNVKFRYGYVDGTKSKVYSGTVTSYDIEFNPNGAVLTLEGLSSAISSFSNPKSKSYIDMTIDQIVVEIANEEGWQLGTIVPCEPVSDGESANKTFTRNNQNAQVFIVNELIPYAKSADTGDSDFLLNFEDNADGTIVNFYPSIQIARLNSSVDHNYEFQWGSGDPDSKVISFNPDYSGTLALMSGGATIEASTVDKIANEMFSLKYDNTTDANRTVLGSMSNYNYSSAKRVIGGSSYSMDEMRKLAAYMWYKNASYPVNAELVILGDPSIKANEMISVVMLNKDGLPHHSSGVYLIKEIEDDISGGSFVSKLILYRNALNVGIDESGGVNITASTNYSVNSVSGADYNNKPNKTSSSPSGTSRSDIVELAATQIGNSGGYKYWSWWGYSSRVAWCAIFVSWCADQCSVPRSVIPKYQGCTDGISQFKKLGRWRSASSYVPQRGDIIFFDSESNSHHTGIVESCDGTTVYTIEGNTSDQVARRSYNLKSPSRSIAGYGYTG